MKLPSEIIEEILFWHSVLQLDVYVADATGSDRSFPEEYWPDPTLLLAARQVCSHWRTLVLDTPRLSTHIMVNRAAIVRDLLERSNSLPLHIVVPFPPTYTEAKAVISAFDVISEHWSKVAHATLLPLDWDVQQSAFRLPLGTIDATSLQTLQVACRRRAGERGGLISTDPPLLHGSAFPILEAVECIGGAIDLYQPILCAQSLRSLVIRKMDDRANIEQLARYLGDLPQLEELTLKRALEFRNPSSLQLPSDHPITLPSLQRLVIIEEELTNALHFLDNVVYPADCCVRLVFTEYRDIARNSLVSKARALGVLGQPDPFQSVFVRAEGSDVLIRLWTSTPSFFQMAEPDAQENRPSLELHALATELDMASLVLDAFTEVSRITRAFLSYTGAAVVSWETMADTLSELDDVAVEVGDVASLPEALFVDKHDDAESIQVAFPRLQVLRLNLCGLGDDAELFLYTLADALKSRTEEGYMLREVRAVIPPRISVLQGWGRLITMDPKVTDAYWMRLASSEGAIEKLYDERL